MKRICMSAVMAFCLCGGLVLAADPPPANVQAYIDEAVKAKKVRLAELDKLIKETSIALAAEKREYHSDKDEKLAAIKKVNDKLAKLREERKLLSGPDWLTQPLVTMKNTSPGSIGKLIKDPPGSGFRVAKILDGSNVLITVYLAQLQVVGRSRLSGTNITSSQVERTEDVLGTIWLTGYPTGKLAVGKLIELDELYEAVGVVKGDSGRYMQYRPFDMTPYLKAK